MLTKEKALIFVVESLKKNQNLPFEIMTAKCPKRNKSCKKRHGDYIVLGYNRDKFNVRSYGIHSESFSESTFTPTQLFNALLYCIKKKKITLPKLLDKIDISSYYKSKRLVLGFSEEEWKIIRQQAGHMNTRDWAIKKLLE